MSNLLPLDVATDPAICGHKAASLAALRNQGFDVPDGFVIPAGARATTAEIAAGLARLGGGRVAVRSSGLAEDLPDASFAGQYDTVLNVEGVDAVLEAAMTCVASARGDRVGLYGCATRPMAVLVQRMIEADASGVAFSADPLTGNRGVARVSATRGLGDKLVSGAIDADEWLVNGERAAAVAQPQEAIDADLALRVAALARRAESVRLAPQDIEWALAGDRLWLLQSRPITVLPIPPRIEAPAGTWQKDAAHFAEPLSPFAASTQLRDSGQFLALAIAKWGLLFDGARFEVIGHEPYIHVEPDDGGRNPPPWWLLAVVARLLPSMRRKLRAAETAVASGLLDSLPAEWEAEIKPRLRGEIERLLAIDLAALDDDALFLHIGELRIFYAECLKLHFTLAVPNAVGLYELASACEELLGWDLQKATALLQGLSRASTAASDELLAIARRATRSTTRELLGAARPDLLERLDEIDPQIANELRRYLRFWGVRPIGPEAGSPSLAERPQLVADLLADLTRIDGSTDLEAGRLASIEEARARLDGAARRRFDAALAYAERVYPLREDNVLLTDQLPAGLLRRTALEAGRRLVEAGLIARAEDALMLSAEELSESLRDRTDVCQVVSRRRAEHAWVRANPGPMTYGPEPGLPPDLRGLPEPARRINRAMIWMLGHELTPPPTADGGAIVGIGVSPGLYRGRVRTIRAAEQLHTLRTGEVLVCPTTSAAWMIVFRRAGAIVTDTGSVLSHTAIVAREFALPAVVATGNGTSRLMDGEEVTVDGARGIVTRVSSGAVQ